MPIIGLMACHVWLRGGQSPLFVVVMAVMVEVVVMVVSCQHQSCASHPDKIKHVPWICQMLTPVKFGGREMMVGVAINIC